MKPRSPNLPVTDGLPATRSRRAFTILEMMLAIAIFSLVIGAIYSTWTAVLRSAKVGADAATDLQRSRIASRTLQDALVSAVMFQANQRLYAFEVDTDGTFAGLSFVARLPSSFLGSGHFAGQEVRRLTFYVDSASSGVNELILEQRPLLQTNLAPEDLFTVVLAREVSQFEIELLDPRKGWVDEWETTNQLPRQVRFALAFSQGRSTSGDAGTTVRTVDIPAVTVLRQWQVGLPGVPGQPAPGNVNPPADPNPPGGNP